MRITALLSLSLAVALGMPPFDPDVLQHPILTEDQRPLVADWLPVHGHVVVAEPAPQPRPNKAEEPENLDVKVKEDVKGEEKPRVKDEPELREQPGFKEEGDVKEKPEDEKPQQQPEAMPEVKVDPELPGPDFKVESEVKVEPEIQEKQEFQREMDHEAESETGLEAEEKHIDMEGKYEMMDQPVMHLEPMNDDDDDDDVNFVEEERHIDMEGKYEMMDQPIMHLEPMNDDDDDDVNFGHEMSEEELLEVEKSLRAAFQNQDPVPKEEEVALGERNNEPVLEPQVSEDQEQVMPGAVMVEEGPKLDAMGEPILPLEEYFPNKEDFIGPEPEIEQNPLAVDTLMMENPEMEFVNEEGPEMDGMPHFEEPVTDDDELHGGDQATGLSYRPDCAGVALEGKCYVFFKGPKRAEEAEFFCQRSFTGGHLASITNQEIHTEVMNLILQKNGAYTRTWIGGLRYLQTGRFIWLDGAHWGYADWLRGEPNNTADKEHCVEVLAYAIGKFNDFTCWEPQAFVCSYPY